jgi:hypothetical protein
LHENTLEMTIVNQHHAYGIDFQCIEGTIDFPQSKLSYWCDEQNLYLHIPHVAKYFVDASANLVTIEVDPLLTCREIIDTWLYGTVLAYLLQFQNYLVLHGSAVLINHEAVIFSGHSGIGKSTIAFAMAEHNYPILTDDLVVIRQNQTGQLELLPSTNHLKLWQDVLAHFDRNTDRLKPVLNKPGKYVIPFSSAVSEPVPISSIYELNSGEQSQPMSCIPVYHLEASKLLIKHTYRYEMLRPLNKLTKHFFQITQLLKNIKLFSITRPANLFQLDDLIKMVEISEGR